MRQRLGRSLLLGAVATTVLASLALADEANNFGLPNPPQADLPYLIHAGNLLPTEKAVAGEESKNKQTTYYLAGAKSSARTPIAGPEFLLQSEELDPYRLQLYGFEVSKGRREITFIENKPKKNPQPYILSVFAGDPGLFKVRVDASLERGEYCLTPEGANDLFCFTVY